MAGVRHRLDGRRGDDAFAWVELPDGAGVVVAVADGVSATPSAALAAQTAVAAACGRPDEVDKDGNDERAPSARCGAAVSAAAIAVADAVGDVANGATTLVVIVIGADGHWAALRVGDSDAFILDGSRNWRPVFAMSGHLDEEDVQTGATDALPGPAAPRQEAEGHLAPDEVLVLLTDGVAGPLRDGPATVARGLADGLAFPPSPLELAVLIDFGRQGCHDDRTVVAVWPAPSTADR